MFYRNTLGDTKRRSNEKYEDKRNWERKGKNRSFRDILAMITRRNIADDNYNKNKEKTNELKGLSEKNVSRMSNTTSQ